MTKILTVLARGLEGAGVEKNSIEFTNWVNSKYSYKYQAAMVANSDIKWGRGNAHKHNSIILSFTKQMDELKTLVDEYDILLFMCTPLKKSSDEIKDSFVEILDYANSKGKTTCYFQFDHKIRSLSTNMYSDPKYFNIFEKFDIVFNHSHNNDFAIKYIQKNGIKCKKMICRGDYNIDNLFAIDFDKTKAVWKDYDAKLPRSIKFIGRSSGWKGPWKFRDLHFNHFMKDGYISSAEGIELSIGTLVELYKTTKSPKIARDDVTLDYISATKANVANINAGNITFERNKPIYFMPPYDHDVAMERLSTNMSGIELLMMSDEFMTDTIENAMFEIVATGCIPIFRKRWAECFTLNGKPLTAYGDRAGTIFLDEEHPEEALKKMNNIADDKELYDAMRNRAYKFYKSFFDVTPVYERLIDVILKEKDENK